MEWLTLIGLFILAAFGYVVISFFAILIYFLPYLVLALIAIWIYKWHSSRN